MRISISQPTLFPWLGYFHIIKNSDVFVFLDNVKFEKRSWQMRNKLKSVTVDGEFEIWIRIPTKLEKTDTEIKDVMIDNDQDWKSRHIHAFQSHYGKNFEDVKFLLHMYDLDWSKLADFNIHFIKSRCNYLNISTRIFKASELSVEGKKGQLLLNICRKFHATEYLTTIGSKEYLDNDIHMFEQADVKIIYSDFVHPVYKQKGLKFIEKLSILDLLFNEKQNSSMFI